MSHFFARAKFASSIAVLSTVILTGCTSLSEKQTGAIRAVDSHSISSKSKRQVMTLAYDCEQDFHFVARVEKDLEAVSTRVFLPGETVRLPVVVSASGAKFSNGKITYWSSKDMALLEYNGREYRQCRVNRKRSVWEDARLSGVDFRAVGNEPGWTLEIRNRENILFVTNYGEDRYTFPAPKPVSHSATRSAEYKTSSGGHTLILTLESKRCDDTMADDETYPTTVHIQFDDRHYMGCGMPLRALNHFSALYWVISVLAV